VALLVRRGDCVSPPDDNIPSLLASEDQMKQKLLLPGAAAVMWPTLATVG
jgi:hypothetical protein